ncbi:sigma factor binding protein 1 chloroplastic [Phtheirospermum japonicum]|uniref:Sigma factor binding protein 1 chloroplastic n=1 Tax=Phtheirospermum japonicum TaxID=374723 RepID=A0A830C4Y1_9LAMI|nr:sigma factor binding protein 1 chloroplastic [Phtheirospermum japonicum]
MNVDQRVPRSVKSQKKNYKGKRKNEESLKVVYISSPMKVKTSASQFRSLVQQLTGKNSDIAQYNFHEINCCDDHESLAKETRSPISNDTPTSSDYSLGHMDHAFISQFDGIFSSQSFYDPSQMDVLGSFDELL